MGMYIPVLPLELLGGVEVEFGKGCGRQERYTWGMGYS